MDHRPSVDLLESTHFFPGVYIIKAIGRADDDFESRVIEAVCSNLAARSDLDYSGSAHARRPPRGGDAGYHRADGRTGPGDLRRHSRAQGIDPVVLKGLVNSGHLDAEDFHVPVWPGGAGARVDRFSGLFVE